MRSKSVLEIKKKTYRPLTKSQDFQKLKTHGSSFHVNSWLLVNLQTTQLGLLRCGWTIPRQIGGAVVRNRFKRWGREYLRKWSAESKPSLDMNLVFKRKDKGFYGSVSHKEFDEALDKMVVKLQRYVSV